MPGITEAELRRTVQLDATLVVDNAAFGQADPAQRDIVVKHIGAVHRHAKDVCASLHLLPSQSIPAHANSITGGN